MRPTLIITAAVLHALWACNSDEHCGPEDKTVNPITVTTPDGIVTYSEFTSSPNNDCTPTGASVTSLTLSGIQTSPAPTQFAPSITLCIPRPDILPVGSPIAVGMTNDNDVRIVDVSGELAGCVFDLDRTMPPPVTTTFTGYCDDGSNNAGYALTLAGQATLTSSCPDAAPITATVSGTAAVQAQ